MIAVCFCEKGNEKSALVPEVVFSIIQQFKNNLKPYRELIEKDPVLMSLDSITSCYEDPRAAFKGLITEPLISLREEGLLSGQAYYVIAIDGLSEAEYYRTDPSVATLAEFVEEMRPSLPNWIKLLLTVGGEKEEISLVKRMPFQKMRYGFY